ncbi:MAG: hypothetical protein QXX87_02085 [Candidatus Jordarchaeales archaeon]
MERDTAAFAENMHFEETRRLARLKLRWGKWVLERLAAETGWRF